MLAGWRLTEGDRGACGGAVVRRTLSLFCLLAAGLTATAPCEAGEAERPRYVLAVVPYQLPLTVHKDWAPLAERLAKRLDARIEIKAYRTFPSFEEELTRGLPDFVFMNPYHQVMTRKAQGYIPIVRGGQPLNGILVVRHNSPIKDVRELDGKIIGFPAPNAFAASLYMRALLTEKLKIRFLPIYLDTHNEVYRQVIMEEADAGGGIPYTLERESAAVRERLRVLYTTPATPAHALSAHPRVPEAVRRTVLRTILEMGADEANMKLLENVQLGKPVEANYSRDYQPLEKLGLEKYVVPGVSHN